jgi:hypothetical protein
VAKRKEGLIMKKFRTQQEMRQRYHEINKMPSYRRPYAITLALPDRYFGFLGISHTNDPEDSQWQRYFEEWDNFLASSNPLKVVFHEGNSLPAKGETREEAIIDGADSGLTAWLAKGEGIKFISPEPNLTEEVERLKTDYGYSEVEIMTYYIGRQMSQWVRYDHSKGLSLNDYIEKTLRRYQETYSWNTDFSLDDARKIVEEVIEKRLEEGAKEDFQKIDDPSKNPVSSACSQIRDESIFSAVEKAWSGGKDVFCVYGSGHAIVMEPALRELIGSSGA